MKVLFIEAKKKISEKIFIPAGLPENLHILYTIQYKDLAEKIKSKLKNQNHKIAGFEQILGCSEIKPKASLLLIGNGNFHALSIIANTGLKKEIFIYEKNRIRKIEKNDIEKIRKKILGKTAKFLASEKIGVLFSKKPGQNRLKEAVKLKRDLDKKYKDKKFSLFLADNICINELENFPIDFWINFACLGIEFDSNKIINYQKILNIKIKK